MRESVPRQVDKESRGPPGERGLEFSRRKKGQTSFFPLHSLVCKFFSLSPELMITEETTKFKLCTKDYITIMYPA